MPHTLHRGGDGLFVQDCAGAEGHRQAKPVGGQAAQHIQLHRPHGLQADLPGLLVPADVQLGVLLGQLAQALGNLMQLTTIPTELIQMVPYLTTLIGLAVYSYVTMKRKNRLQSKSTL